MSQVLTPTLADSASLSAPLHGYEDERHVFESVNYFIDWLEDKSYPATPNLTDNQRTQWLRWMASNISYGSVRGKFNAVETYEEAIKLARYGWPEGRDRMLSWEGEVKRALSRLVEMPHFRLGDEGSDVEMGRFMNGEPEHMIGYGVTNTYNRSPLILVDMNVGCIACGSRCCEHAPARADWSMMRGAVLFLLVKLMRQAGLYPEVWLGASALYDDHQYTHTYNTPLEGFTYLSDEQSDIARRTSREYRMGYDLFKLERPLQAKKRSTFVRALSPGGFFDPSRLAFYLAHDAMSRRLQFRFEEYLNLAECGVYPAYVSGSYDGRGVILGDFGNSPLDVGALPRANAYITYKDEASRVARIDPEARADWRYLVGNDQRNAIFLPSYTALHDLANNGKMGGRSDDDIGQAKAAIGAFNNPESAASYLLGILEGAGVKLK